MEFPSGLYYGPEHEWSRINEDGTVTVGITDYAQHELGEVIFISLPRVGDSMEAGRPFGEVESAKTAAEIYAPCTGQIIEANEALLDNPELLNHDPYGEGWIACIQPADLAELEVLMNAEAYQQHVIGQH